VADSGLLPKFGQCPRQVIRSLCVPPDPIGKQVFSSTYNWRILAAGLRIRSATFKFLQGVGALLGQLMNIPTDTLIDMLYTILVDDFAITANDATEIEQIQRELQRRGQEQGWSFQSVN
jgi:hypothetical protein